MDQARYKILEKVGEGGGGSVFKALDTVLDREIALKRLALKSADDDYEERMKEARLTCSLQHPNIVAVYDVDGDDEGTFIVMEFLNGEDLGQVVSRGALPLEDLIITSTHVLEGLVAAHALNMIHRDIKPSNVMTNWLRQGQYQAKILDFGLAKCSKAPSKQTANIDDTVEGSIFFMSPEQFRHQPLDVRTDIYSAGCLFYYLLTSRNPFVGETITEVIDAHLEHRVVPIQQVRPGLSDAIGTWVMWMMNPSPDDRPQSAAEALAMLREIL